MDNVVDVRKISFDARLMVGDFVFRISVGSGRHPYPLDPSRFFKAIDQVDQLLIIAVIVIVMVMVMVFCCDLRSIFDWEFLDFYYYIH